MPAAPLTATRRTALGAAAGIACLSAAGCTSSDHDPSQPTDPISTSGPPVDADQELAASVVADIAAAGALVDQLARDVPALMGDLRPWRRLHAAHAEALGGVEDSIPSPAPGSGSPTEALRELRRAEQRLQRNLTAACVDAESGTLAKLLASMAAAVAQHLVVLP